jgi:hypothetical protein
VDEAGVPADIPIQAVLAKPFFLPDLPALITRVLGPNPAGLASNSGVARSTAELRLVEPEARPRNPRVAVTGPLSAPAPLRTRLTATGILTPPLVMTTEVRRHVENHVEMMSRALRDEPVFLAQGDKVLAMVPRLSPSATSVLVRVVARAWEVQASAPEVIRFEGDTEINRYMLYSVRVAGDITLSVALRMRIPLPIVRRVARDTAAELVKLVRPGLEAAGSA